MSKKNLPIILVCAADVNAASTVISKLVDNEVDEEEKGTCTEGSVTWRLENKYYTADVRVWPLADGGAPPPEDLVEAHVIYLTEDECAGADGGAALAEARAARGAGAAVRLVLAAAAPAPLRRWARAARTELLAPADVGRARDALQAHVWPGLARAPPAQDGVERAEAFAAALGALAPAARHARELPPPERLDAAERLVAAFCRALGCDLDDC